PLGHPMMRHFTSFPLDDDVIQQILCWLPDFSSLKIAVVSCKAFHRVWSIYPIQIEHAVATNIVGSALPQALRLARYQAPEANPSDPLMAVQHMETDAPRRIKSFVKRYLVNDSVAVSKLEDIFSTMQALGVCYTRQHKTRLPLTSQLTEIEAYRFRRAMYRYMLYCHLFNMRYPWIYIAGWHGEYRESTISQERRLHVEFLQQFDDDGLRQINTVSEFLSNFMLRILGLQPLEPECIVLAAPEDFLRACGPIEILECYRTRSLIAMEDLAYDVTETGIAEEIVSSFFVEPLKQIMQARKAEFKPRDMSTILDDIPGEQATCDRCRAVKGFRLYDWTNYQELRIAFREPDTAHFSLPGLFKGHLAHHCTEGRKIKEYFDDEQFNYNVFMEEMFTYSAPVPATPAQADVSSASLEQWADAVDGEEPDATEPQDAPQASSAAPLAGAGFAGPSPDSWDGLSTSDALCISCIQGYLAEFLPRWWLDHQRKAGATIPQENCWYGWNCRTQTHSVHHATRLNHFCKPTRGEGV
ncbi:hypothetical protein HDZ31DRAFT_38350, partial [Schizophyllum fasciatum]